MKPSSVCIGAMGDSFGNFSVPTSGHVITFKLIYQSGYLQCSSLDSHRSHWGCSHPIVPAGYNMGIHITDSQRKRLLPKDEFMKDAESSDCLLRLYYSLPGLTIDSPELLFDNFTTPLPVTVGEEFQIWFAEDFGNCLESDNEPEATCAEVFGLFV